MNGLDKRVEQGVSPTGETMTLYAPAKVNLILKVTGRRDDGYHDLFTHMQKLDLCDVVQLTRRETPGIGLTCSNAELPADETNLVWRAARAFFDTSGSGVEGGIDIHLEKKIPLSAGLGGGSSDAGAVLKGMNTLFAARLSEQRLVAMARELGADVPFFATDHPAVVATGIGDEMTPVASVCNYSFLLVNPGFSVSTRWVFENYTLTTVHNTFKVSGFQNVGSDSASFVQLENDLEHVTLKHYPELHDIKKKLIASGATQALMSGSGPTVFGVFADDTDEAQETLLTAAQMLQQEYGSKVFITRPMIGA